MESGITLALVSANKKVVFVDINEAADALYNKTASRDDIDMAMKLETRYLLGFLQWANEIDVDHPLNIHVADLS